MKARRLAVTPFELLLPYQRTWVLDSARFKIWLKSRQIGGSLAAAFEIVADAIERASDWIVLSAGERQALEFMEKVNRAAAIFAQAVAFETGAPFAPDSKLSQIRFPNGARILALPANPATARGYSANLVLDEFAFHENPEDIWRAVYPIITNPLRGALKLRVISTPAGMNSKFFDLWSDAPDFSRHKTTVYDAVEQGLALDVAELKANLADPDGWAQEFECQFMEHAAQVFPLDLIHAAEHADARMAAEVITRNPLFVGIDIGRRRDLTVAWTLERTGGALWTREVLVLDGVRFPEQEGSQKGSLLHVCVGTSDDVAAELAASGHSRLRRRKTTLSRTRLRCFQWGGLGTEVMGATSRANRRHYRIRNPARLSQSGL